MRLGAHLSIAKGLDKTVVMAKEIGANTFQFFTRNPRGGAARSIPEEEITLWNELRKQADLYPIAGHLPYTVNFASSDNKQKDFAAMVLHDDALRVAAIGGEYLISHPGHHDGHLKEGLDRVVEIIKKAYLPLELPAPMLLLETMAGQGKEVGSINDLQYILARLNWPQNIGICLDSAHLFAAGRELRAPKSCQMLVEELDKKIGLERIKVLHLNDSLASLGSHRDRHAGIGKGELGMEGIASIINNPFLGKLALILETPVKNYKEYAREIQLIKTLVIDG